MNYTAARLFTGAAGAVLAALAGLTPAAAGNLPTIPTPGTSFGVSGPSLHNLGPGVTQLLQISGLDLNTAPAAAPALPGAAGPVKAQLSGVAELAKSGLDVSFGNDDSGLGDAFPGTGVPRVPARFAPDVLVNQDRSALPHNETSVAVNPKNPENIVVGANDYSLGFGSSGFYSTFDGGRSWYGGVLPMPTVYYEPPGYGTVPDLPHQLDALDGGGDPAVAFGSDGTVYYAEINFHRVGCISGVFVFRSSNGGQTWSRPLIGTPSAGDTRFSGDGVPSATTNDNDCHNFYDKEYIATGPRPAGAPLVSGTDPAHVTSYRLYVTYTNFFQVPPVAAQPWVPPAADVQSPVTVQYSDDQGRTWSPQTYINGTSPNYCSGSLPLATLPPGPVAAQNACIDSTGSDPVVDPRTGAVYVAFWNGDGSGNCVNQVLVVRSLDGGQTWGDPSQAGCLSVTNPVASSSVCPEEPSGETLISGYCFRVPAQTEQSIAVDPLDGSLHVVFDDNRNGGSNWDLGASDRGDLDVFTAASKDGGQTWSAPVRVNQDRLKDGRDQFFPWGAFGPDGTYYVSFLDRSLDPSGQQIGESLAISHDGGRTFMQRAISTGVSDGNRGFRDGLFLGDYTGVAASALGAFAAWPDTRRAAAPISGTTTYQAGENPTSFWSDIVGGGTYSSLGATAPAEAPSTGSGTQGAVQAASATKQSAGAAAAPPRAAAPPALAPTGVGPIVPPLRAAGHAGSLPIWALFLMVLGLVVVAAGLTAVARRSSAV